VLDEYLPYAKHEGGVEPARFVDPLLVDAGRP
jgi:hypothetical protein